MMPLLGGDHRFRKASPAFTDFLQARHGVKIHCRLSELGSFGKTTINKYIIRTSGKSALLGKGAEISTRARDETPFLENLKGPARAKRQHQGRPCRPPLEARGCHIGRGIAVAPASRKLIIRRDHRRAKESQAG